MPANACLLVLASLLPCAMPRAKSPPCLAAAAVRPCAAFWPGPLLLLLLAWACALCSPPELALAAPVLLRLLLGCRAHEHREPGAACPVLPTCTHKNRERDQTNPKRASELNQNRPLRGQEEGRASFPMDSKFNSPSKNSNPRRGRMGTRRTKQNRRGRRGLVSQGVCCPLLSFLSPLTL